VFVCDISLIDGVSTKTSSLSQGFTATGTRMVTALFLSICI